MKNPLYGLFLVILLLCQGWGFYAHRQINRLAVFTLPPDMIAFYKKHIQYLADASVNPDRRRFVDPDEAPRHYIDIDHFGDSAVYTMPRYWEEAVATYSEDTLTAYGVLPWHINKMYYRLRETFLLGDPEGIIRISSEMGHYIADAHVPLHTTENYNGQLTGQHGIHAFWESRLPELFFEEYDFFVGRASYVHNIQIEIWKVIEQSHQQVDSVLLLERRLSAKMEEKKYSFETKGRQTQRVYSQEYSQEYHEWLNGMVERQMRAAVKMTGNIWYTAWVDAGQPDLRKLLDYEPTEDELRKRREELDAYRQQVKTRQHEGEEE